MPKPDYALAGQVPPDDARLRTERVTVPSNRNGSIRCYFVRPAGAQYDAELTKAGVVHQFYVYAVANHGFHNDTTPRYDRAAATLAWDRTLAWFKQYLQS